MDKVSTQIGSQEEGLGRIEDDLMDEGNFGFCCIRLLFTEREVIFLENGQCCWIADINNADSRTTA